MRTASWTSWMQPSRARRCACLAAWMPGALAGCGDADAGVAVKKTLLLAERDPGRLPCYLRRLVVAVVTRTRPRASSHIPPPSPTPMPLAGAQLPQIHRLGQEGCSQAASQAWRRRQEGRQQEGRQSRQQGRRRGGADCADPGAASGRTAAFWRRAGQAHGTIWRCGGGCVDRQNWQRCRVCS